MGIHSTLWGGKRIPNCWESRLVRRRIFYPVFQFSLCVVCKICMYIIWGSEAFWTGAQVQATQGVCPQLREKGRTLTDTYAYITQSVKYNNLTRVMYENYFSSIFFFTISILMDFRYFVTLRFYGTIFESSRLGRVDSRLERLYS